MTKRTAEPTAVVDTVPAVPETATPAPEAPPATPLVESELLVEDVSIDGMCGVY